MRNSGQFTCPGARCFKEIGLNEGKINMYLDETTTKLLVFLAAALIMIIFAELAFLYETSKECKELRQENLKLSHKKSDIRRSIATANAAIEKNRHETYRAAFERNMKRNTADPARHVKEDITE